jgi:lysine 6-dehydrogenase
MNILVLGAGLMGRAIAFDLQNHSICSSVTLLDDNKLCLEEAKKYLGDHSSISFYQRDVTDFQTMNSFFSNADLVISAVPYLFNEELTKLAINNQCHFIDLGGNNTVVEHQKKMFTKAKQENVTIIPDSGLAPGLVSILTKKLVDEYSHLSSVKLRVGGLPKYPKDPWKYQLVFSANGLINEYVEDAIILDHKTIKTIPSLTDCEEIYFPEPFGKLEAFITSGGCSTLPYSYKKSIDYLDYKTIRYPGHLQQIKPLFDLGMDSVKKIQVKETMISPRDVLILLLHNTLPNDGEDVVLLKVMGETIQDEKQIRVTYEMIDYFDVNTNLSAMMRTTGFPVSVTADLILKKDITDRGVFTPEEIIPVDIFLNELEKRNILIKKTIEPIY